MTRTKKLFAAAAILASGYGLASLFGEPAKALLSRGLLPPEPAIARTSSAAALPAPVEYAPGELRLVPDARPIEVPIPEATLQQPERARDTFSADLSLAEVAATPAPAPTEPDWFSNFEMNSAPPRASLRNEAPRPLFTEPRASIAPLAAPPVLQNNVPARYWGPPPGETASAASAVLPAEYERDSAIRETAQTALAASTATLPVEPKTAIVPFIAPPLSQPLEEQDSPRTHIIIDGDSLPKLAGRYLDDPRREREIYELNRHVLSDPELLPIGAELVIPRRSQVLDGDNYLPQSALPGSLAAHAAARGGLVPVRPVPTGSEAMPRAQLARPLPAP